MRACRSGDCIYLGAVCINFGSRTCSRRALQAGIPNRRRHAYKCNVTAFRRPSPGGGPGGAAQEAHAAVQRRAEEAQRIEREAVAMAAAGSGPGCTRHEWALLQAAATETKCAETVEAGQDLARAAAQLRKLLRLADVAQHAVAVAASTSPAGDDMPPSVSLGPAAPAGDVGVGRKNSLDGNDT
jgi:hypothetical protein